MGENEIKKRSATSGIGPNDVILAPFPESIIDEAIKRQDWFSAFSNAVSSFEFWACMRLQRYCQTENIHIEHVIERLNARELNVVLHLLKLTDSNIFNKMTKVIRERNILAHPEKSQQRMLVCRYKLNAGDKEKATQILEDAKCCLEKVREGAIPSEVLAQLKAECDRAN